MAATMREVAAFYRKKYHEWYEEDAATLSDGAIFTMQRMAGTDLGTLDAMRAAIIAKRAEG